FEMLMAHPDINIQQQFANKTKIRILEYALNQFEKFQYSKPLKMLLSGGSNTYHIPKGHICDIKILLSMSESIKTVRLNNNEAMLTRWRILEDITLPPSYKQHIGEELFFMGMRAAIYEECDELLTHYIDDPNSVCKSIRMELGYNVNDACKIFCMITLVESHLLTTMK